MSTKRPEISNRSSDASGPASRFAYYGGEQDVEGGVRKAGSTGNKTATGAPGPGDLLLDVSELARTVGMRYTHRFHVPPYPADDLELAAPLDGQVTLTNTGGLLLLRGDVRTRLTLECARCLSPTIQDVQTEIEEEFDLVTAHNAFRQEEVQAVDDDTPASVIRGNVLDLGELLRQNLLLAAPLQPLCSDECSGLVSSEPDLSEETDADVAADNPLRHLAEMLEAKRRGENA